jgi:hypothetical protein
VASLDQLPHPLPNLVSHQSDSARACWSISPSERHIVGTDATTCPNSLFALRVFMIARHRGTGQMVRTAGDRDRHVPQHRASVVEDLGP